MCSTFASLCALDGSRSKVPEYKMSFAVGVRVRNVDAHHGPPMVGSSAPRGGAEMWLVMATNPTQRGTATCVMQGHNV